MKDKSKIQFNSSIDSEPDNKYLFGKIYYIILYFICLAKVGPQVTIKHQVTIRQLKFHDQLHFNIKKQSNMKFINN